ncbi:glycogen synthase GlgA [Falsiroseomonas oryzae]|uniref:glycogen synthase GlgA n=1 Tax=Falsiroseomonas oryzae TaxID=2766473 RepID=UPI0022EB6A4E|nr:glycogen synthase GlgA [Roseomonas sp. MO-31]
MRVLAVASECAPLVKTGGLADVAGALPAALAPQDVQVTTLLPGYPAVMQAIGEGSTLRRIGDLFGGPARLLRGTAAGLDLAVLEAPHLFDRPGNPYLAPHGGEWEDNGIRFAALGAAAAILVGAGGFDAVHAHDWQAGLVPAYLRFAPGRRVPAMFTVHNLAFQGKFPLSLFPRLGLPAEALSVQGVEYYGTVGFLKAGLWYADRITTVSPTYAAEIGTPALGMGLDGLLRGRGGHVSGILNGLDTADFDPSRDKRLAARFSAADPSPRAANKAALQARMGLAPDPDALLFGFVGRLAWQKGVDMLLGALPTLLGEGAQLAVLGTGEWGLEEGCRGAAAAHPGRVGAVIGFDEALARLVYGGADVVLVPSRFEPCGLAQMAALRYGALPLVAHVGGLVDSVVDANEMALAAGIGTGFHFAPVTQEMLAATMLRVARVWRDRAAWRRLQANALATDVSWSRSAARYAALYREMVADAG